MKPIKLYFAGEWGPRPEQGDLNIQNRLVSYLYPKQLSHWLHLTSGKPGNIILDSGAFSAWNKGTDINLSDYIAFAHHMRKRAQTKGKEMFIVNLDVIPGKVGETKSLNKVVGDEKALAKNTELINAAAKQGFKNLKTMISEGITPIHVFHQGEHFRWLDKMLEYTNYIGVSPANDMPTASKKRWINSVFEYLYKHGSNADTHGFAVMIPQLLRDLPWTSCDAISWLKIAATGCVIYPIGGFKSSNFTNYNKPFNQILVSEKKISKGAIGMTDKILRMFEEDGYTYEQLQDYKMREEINVRTYIAFEKWLNEYKAKTEYAPSLKLF